MHKLIITSIFITLFSTAPAVSDSHSGLQGTQQTDQQDQSAGEKRNSIIAAVVSDQLDAFSKDDGKRAFSHASPTIKAYFKTPETFMRMVRTSYQMVYRPKSFELEAVMELQDKVFQPVLFTDQKSQLYKVVYEMQQQEDENWKINGVQVLRPKGIAI